MLMDTHCERSLCLMHSPVRQLLERSRIGRDPLANKVGSHDGREPMGGFIRKDRTANT
jgi:hypothetical protein